LLVSWGVADRIDEAEKWAQLTSVAKVESQRTINGQPRCEVRYYISSLALDAQRLATSIRTHWSVENSLHWVLDVAFREDDCRIRTGHAPANFTLLRHLSASLLNQEQTAQLGMKNKRLRNVCDLGGTTTICLRYLLDKDAIALFAPLLTNHWRLLQTLIIGDCYRH